MNDRILVPPTGLMGDGVFETLHLRPDGPWLLDAHVSRLTRSAALLDMPPPNLPDISDLSGEGAVRIIYTREVLDISVSPIPARVINERRDGIRAISADQGVSIRRPPWSVSAAKTLSYAENFAARRWAVRQGADDLIWLSTEGYVREAPTASVVWLTGNDLHTVPPATAGILPGITAAHLLSVAPSVGLRPAERMITRAELAAADTIWLASSLRGLAEVTSLDGAPRARSPWTPRLLDLLGY
ncbi:aminotransferase class IV [Actinoplanes sp. G11-F43]|uniref:aminotransferase class IV n=1 Tax=Actinoplanes sp. G11-F43 TaxID=3424130 RepID=UPI003D337C09